MLETPTLAAKIPGVGSGGAARWALHFQSGDLNTRTALREVESILSQACVPQEDVENTQIVLAEVLNNITEHAYRGTEGPIELTIDLLDGELRCILRDRGRPMPDGHAPAGSLPPPNCPLEALPEGGFGWYLIHSLTQGLSIERVQGWNVLSFALPFTTEEE